MDKNQITSEEQSMKPFLKIISKMRRKFTIRLTKEINNEFNKINFSLENLTSKLEYLKMIETKYNKSISEEILSLIKDLKMLHSDYLRDKEEEEEEEEEEFNLFLVYIWVLVMDNLKHKQQVKVKKVILVYRELDLI